MTEALTKKKRSRSSNNQGNGALPLHRFSVADYHRMIKAGILTPNDKVELLEGWIVEKMPQDPPHATAITRFFRWLAKILSQEDWTVRIQMPITLSHSEPEPDIAVARGPDTRYEKRHPGPEDVALVIEVGDSSLLDDRRMKGPLYAAAKIPQFWLVNLRTQRVEVYTKPQGGRTPSYRNIVEFTASDAIPLVLDQKRYGELKVTDLLS